MALEEKLGKSAKKHMKKKDSKLGKEKEPEGGGRHVNIEKHSQGGYTVKMHDHGPHELCDGDCESSAHNSMGGAMKAVRGHFDGDQDDNDEGEMGEKD